MRRNQPDELWQISGHLHITH
ncbi:MAG: hypothetical protein JWO08_394, partial [Verrucomicrobiaceae bacterium]|nr:hypothetical protein [Verrucomicrobiaceae bacterium]